MESRARSERRSDTHQGPDNLACILNDDALAELPIKVVPLGMLLHGDSPRLSGENGEHVRTLAQTEERLAPILVHRQTMRIIDGMHRVQAARLRGEQEIEVRLFDGDEESAFVLAVQANIRHGLPLTLADRRAAAARILGFYPEWSDRAIAQAAGLAAPTVSAIRQRTMADLEQLKTRVGRDGRKRPLSTAEGRRLASELISENPGASLREIASKVGISPATVRDVRGRLSRGHDPVPAKQRQANVNGRRHADSRRSRRDAQQKGDTKRRFRDIVRRLQRDPSLRSNEAGRTLLKWLSLQTVGLEKWPKFIENLPPHCTMLMMEAARGLAKTWDEFADELEHRAEEGGPETSKRSVKK